MLLNRSFASLRITVLAGLLATACGKEQSSLAGRGDTVATAAPPAGDLAYVTNEDSQELTVIDTRTDSAVASIPVGTRPRGVRIAPDGKTVFVALSGSPKCPPTMSDEECEKLTTDKSKDGIAVVDVATRKVTRILPGGSDPETFDISRDGSTLFVSNEDADTASIVDIRQWKGPVHGAGGKGTRRGPAAARRLGGLGNRRDRSQPDAHRYRDRQGHGTDPVGKRPRDLAFTPDGSRAYVTSEIDGTVWVIDVPARRRSSR